MILVISMQIKAGNTLGAGAGAGAGAGGTAIYTVFKQFTYSLE